MSEIFNDYNDIDTHGYLTGASVELIIEYLKEQMESPYDYQSRNYVDEFIGDYIFSKNALNNDYEKSTDIEVGEYDEMMNELESYRNQFITTYMELLYQTLNIGFTEFDEDSIEFQNKVLSIVYKFFIINMKRNYTNLCLTYIMENKDELAKAYKRSGDSSTISQRNDIKTTDNGYPIIIASLRDIIREAIQVPYEIDKFVLATYGVDPPEYDQVLMLELINKDIVTGNFVPYYLNMVPETLLDNIEFEIRHILLKQLVTTLDD